MILTARDVKIVLVALQLSHLVSVDALDLVMGVAELPFGGQTPGCCEILGLLSSGCLMLVASGGCSV